MGNVGDGSCEIVEIVDAGEIGGGIRLLASLDSGCPGGPGGPGCPGGPGGPGCSGGPGYPGCPGGPGGIINPAGIFIPLAKLFLISFNNFITPSF